MLSRFQAFWVIMLSMILLYYVVTTIFKNKKLSQHPSTLIASICIIQALISWQAFIQNPLLTGKYFVCYVGMDSLLAFSWFFEVDILHKNEALHILMFSQNFLFQYLQLVSLIINITFCQDLIQTLRNPFETTRIRLIKYIIFSCTVPLIMAIIIASIFPEPDD